MINIKLSGKRIEEELKVYHTGFQVCDKNYSFGPFVRDHYLIHLVTDGSGVLQNQHSTYTINKNQAFIIYPDEKTFYQADNIKPWTYFWIGFHGRESEFRLESTDFSPSSPVIDLEDKDEAYSILQSLVNLDNRNYSDHLRLKGSLYTLFARFSELKKGNPIQQKNTSAAYINESFDYIIQNYSLGIGVEDIADFLNINRSYLTRLYKEHLGISPRVYLTRFRMEKATHLLSNSTLSIGDVARSIGYSDPYTFSKAFKRTMGISPSQHRTNTSCDTMNG